MGASNSRLEEDKGLQLCRARKKFIKQALNGRCSLASAHIAYIEELRIVGNALRRFVKSDAQSEPFLNPSRSITPEPRALSEKSISQLSFSSRSLSHVEANTNVSPTSSTPVSTRYQSHHMKFRSTFSKKVEEKPPVPITVSIASNTPLSNTPWSTEAPGTPPPPWDYFGLFNPIDDHFSSQERRAFDQGSEDSDEMRRVEDVEEKFSSHEIEESHTSEDEFDEPEISKLVRSFKNVNRATDDVVDGDGDGDSPFTPAQSRVSKNVKELRDNLVNGDSPVVNGKKNKSPDLSPLRATSLRFVHLNDVKITPMKQSEVEDKVVPPKDFFTSMKEIEHLFVKASESGKEVPRMLEANKLHFRPVFPGSGCGPITSSLLKSCFSCGEDPSEVPQEPPENSVKYLTWHRTTSSRSASSRNLLGGANSTDRVNDVSSNLFDNFCMVSGSHASTLDRLYAWEKKLYDEVKAGQVLRSNFDQKCRLLRQQESRGENTDKTRAVVKDLHTRIKVAIHRINSISKKIEEIRDKELQPQLEELIEGLRNMWEMMLECHQLQLHIISISRAPGNTKITVQSDSRRQITLHLEHGLTSLLSTFTKWISAQKLYVESIDKWLFKCVSLPQNPSKRNKRMKPPPIRNMGPPIYMICGTWLEMIDGLPVKAVVDSIKDLASGVAHFLPSHEKNHGKGHKGEFGVSMLRDEALEDGVASFDHFRVCLAGFVGQLNKFAECSVKMFSEVQKGIEEAKSNYEQFKTGQ